LRFGAEDDLRERLGRWHRTVRHGAEWQDDLVVRKSAGEDVLKWGALTKPNLLTNLNCMNFPDSMFGVVLGPRFHHVELEKSFREMSRVLTSDRIAMFNEP
jgi:hypothetical protein